MKRILALAAGFAMAGTSASALAQAEGQSQPARRLAVRIVTHSDLDDPALIRPSRPADGYRDWLAVEDFPAEWFPTALYTGHAADLRLHIAPDDRLTACEYVPGGPHSNEIAELACTLILQRGRFHHGIDAAGIAQPGVRNVSATLMLLTGNQSGGPPPAPPPPGASNSRPVMRDQNMRTLPTAITFDPARLPAVWLEISERGRVTGCRIRLTTGSDAGDAALCRHIGSARFDPARTPEGDRVAARSYHVEFTPPQ